VPWLIFAAWTVPALLATLETVVFARQSGHPIGLARAFASEAVGWYTWALCTRGIVILADRYPLERPIRIRHVAVHLGAYLTVALAASLAWAAAGHWLRPTGLPFLALLGSWFLSGLPFTVLVYAAVVAITYTIANRARLRDREQQAEVLARRLAESQLAALRMQLQPHFLFNTVNGIMALVRDQETDRAVSALAKLADLLRLTLRLGISAEVTLETEIGFVRRYLEIEQLRFGDRLRVTFDVSPTLLDAAVPTFVLQPFVENAVRHGITPRRSGGTIAIDASDGDGLLHLSVRDDGVGFAGSENGGATGEPRVGIANARATLRQLYGARAAIALVPGPNGGTTAEIRLPLRRLDPTVEAAGLSGCPFGC
jgi:signal transduction histidine kinase